MKQNVLLAILFSTLFSNALKRTNYVLHFQRAHSILITRVLQTVGETLHSFRQYLVGGSGEAPDPVIFDMVDPDPTHSYLFIEKMAYIPSEYGSISKISK